ncbi:hypothetical protein BJF85_08220 [Saccharomonospora sp. CUA-673]|uniref:hypothetical protein n=1 Tax=Saccharomonospora sp. CUA-673 TaxID=1904969 RepID=UPI00095E525E|nr:hypothetical protein [Saccharomonospora sp. CUA-673]OLT38684.1 hypothetical protein BJF85_08220 [Saccharomonospora sp. CUA-673]
MTTRSAENAHEPRQVLSTPVRMNRIWWILLGVSVALNVISMAVPALIKHPLTTGQGEIRMYLDVFVEGNLPTWWSVALLVVTAVLFGIVGVLAKSAGARSAAWGWWCGAVLLGLLSLDDHTQLHERLDRIGRRLTTFDSDFPFYWLIPGVLAGAVVAAGLLVLAVRLTGRARWLVVGGGALLLWSALGMEAMQGLLIARHESGPLYVLTYHAEELGENVGVLLLMAGAFAAASVRRLPEGTLTLGYANPRPRP